MKNRYILDTSGKIIRLPDNSSDNNPESEPISVSNTLYKDIKNYNPKNYNPEQSVTLHDENISSYLTSNISNLEEVYNNPEFIAKNEFIFENDSFGFESDDVVHYYFKQLNSFLNLAEDDRTIPQFDEFQIYTGVNTNFFNQNGGLTDAAQSIPRILFFILDYLATIAVETATIEAIIIANKAVFESHNKKNTAFEGLKNDKNFDTLVLGEYILEEVDVYSRYFLEVLNYPFEEKDYIGSRFDAAGLLPLYALKRFTCYTIGFTEWLVQDRVLDWKKIVEKGTQLRGQRLGGNTSIDRSYLESIFPNINTYPDDIKEGFKSAGKTLWVVAVNALEISIDALLNYSSSQKLSLLIKKFANQKYWVNEQLYNAKSKSRDDVIIDNFNYYYFKFFIERVNVGIKIWNRNFDSDSLRHTIESKKNKNYNTNRIAQDYSKIKKFKRVMSKTTDVTDLKSLANSIRTETNAKDALTQLAQLKDSVEQGKINSVDYDYGYDYNSLSLTNIPSALMFNNSIKNLVKNSPEQEDKLLREEYQKIINNKMFAKTDLYKIPIELVNRIENELEYEYMPFYFHDLRTNEILSFHAFVENLSDSYTPEYTSTGGFGRIDDVKAYVKTSRSISLTFVTVAMNREDHDVLWYYVNKLVTMVYPQWTRGEILKYNGKEIQQPFSQVPSNSPLIRMRLGDVIKSNYSKYNLNRIFGLDESGHNQKEINNIMRPFNLGGASNNPITQSYESGMGRGLAGHITQLDLNYFEFNWETDMNSKAPQGVKVTMSFSPIHDIAPGLDYKGMPRAVNYNVGKINNELFGDPLQKYIKDKDS